MGENLSCPMAGPSPRKAANTSDAWVDPSSHKSTFVIANGVRLHYLDWGGSGPPLILIHGFGDNPHYFDDLAPTLADRFRVFAYARRGHGQSDPKGPFDTPTFTEDLRGFMDGVGISKAHLAGHSMGGNEITSMAATHPKRVARIVYLDAGYDWADPAFVSGSKARDPSYANPPEEAYRSIEAYKTYQRTLWWAGVSDPGRYEAYVRELVIVQPDGTLRPRVGEKVTEAMTNYLFTAHRDYTGVRAPALAIYSTTFADLQNGDPVRVASNRAWETEHLTPFRTASMERVRRELSKVELVTVPGTHADFFFNSRDEVATRMKRFLRSR
jgi:pimeloyl-ACP methyl ester carboxylesterase